ncbi:MAG: 2-amino-4-hydroxy-6-hydroxymethyldihydropteridine diphosphokinase [Pseudomonadota bacterium]|nr:2-amino-4-hydroxy-6-hydroxymethyldihydropteridine diphosphokinase [Pseudomonadota bacterium]
MSMTEVLAYIGLGSNLDNPESQLKTAIEALTGLPQTRLQARSSLYRSAPMGPQDQPDYLNAVVQLSTGLEPEALLDKLQGIEQAQGRVRAQHWGPRTLDLDILLYGEDVVATERLKIPHPGIAERSFVLYPLAEINGQLEIPELGGVGSLMEQCPDAGLSRLPITAQSAG